MNVLTGDLCRCGRKLESGYNTVCKRCAALPRDEHGLPKWRFCCNCGGVINGGGHGHFIPPGGGDPGFFACKPKEKCLTCNGTGKIESSTSGRAYYDAPMMVPCPTCGTAFDPPNEAKQGEKGTMRDTEGSAAG